MLVLGGALVLAEEDQVSQSVTDAAICYLSLMRLGLLRYHLPQSVRSSVRRLVSHTFSDFHPVSALAKRRDDIVVADMVPDMVADMRVDTGHGGRHGAGHWTWWPTWSWTRWPTVVFSTRWCWAQSVLCKQDQVSQCVTDATGF